MTNKNLQELIEEGSINIETTYRVYEQDSDLPLYLNSDGKTHWYENMTYNKMIVKDCFNKLFLMPNVRVDSNEESEPTVNLTLSAINSKGAWEQFCKLKGWDTYRAAERISDWNERAEVPLSKAKSWGLI